MINRLARGAQAGNRRHKAISPAFDVRDVTVSELAVPKRLSDRSNVYAEASLLDDYIRPSVINELLLSYDLAGAPTR